MPINVVVSELHPKHIGFPKTYCGHILHLFIVYLLLTFPLLQVGLMQSKPQPRQNKTYHQKTSKNKRKKKQKKKQKKKERRRNRGRRRRRGRFKRRRRRSSSSSSIGTRHGRGGMVKIRTSRTD